MQTTKIIIIISVYHLPYISVYVVQHNKQIDIIEWIRIWCSEISFKIVKYAEVGTSVRPSRWNFKYCRISESVLNK